MIQRNCIPFLIISVLSILVVGCASEIQFEGEATVEVVGKVLLDGEPVQPPKQVSVEAIAEEGAVVQDGKKVQSANATAAPDGRFELSTYVQGDGVRQGKYKITFKVAELELLRGRLGEDILQGKYADPDTSEYSVTVTGSETEPIDLGTINLATP